MKKIEIDSGRKFGSWTVIGDTITKNSKILISAKCVCGNVRYVYKTHLLRGASSSCGCQIQVHKTHGMSGQPIYRVWRAMIDRCTLKTCKSYKRYGGDGITICKEWMEFERFYADMGDRPTQKHSIDRINNYKGYEPENCRWATSVVQARNKKAETKTKSGVRGITQRPNGRWQVRIMADYKSIYIGTFKELSAAIAARKASEAALWQNQ